MRDPIADAAEAALAGGLVVLPTDTVYGIGTRPDDAAATRRLFDAKGRPRDLALPVLVASRAAAEAVAVFDERSVALTARFWPGPLSLVLERTDRSQAWDLGQDRATIAVRMPHHPLALALLARTGPLAVTSANRSGEPTPGTCAGLHRVFGDDVDMYLCQQEPLEGSPSTVVDLAYGELRIVRPGTVIERDILAAIGEEAPS